VPTGLFTPSDDVPPDDAMPLGEQPRHRRSPGRSAPWLFLSVGAVVVLALGALVWTRSESSSDKPKVNVPPISQPSNADDPFYLVPGGPAEKQRAAWIEAGRDEDAAQLEKIASQPVASWFAYDGSDSAAKMKKLFQDAAKAKRVPVMVAYDLPHRDCGQYSSGGAANAEAYEGFIANLAAAAKGSHGYLILEPDAIPHTLDGCLTDAQSLERYKLLWHAVETLKANTKLKVYLDAGNAAWISADKMSQALYAAGLEHADGFSLNVSNFEATDATIAYGKELSQQTAGKHFVIDTSRNGKGALPDKNDKLRWCNPPGRALGASPTTKTGNPLVDAYLWVKQPGTSDGSCRDGAPDAGQWWADYALQLAAAT
jgi:endoglucanase